MMRTPDRGNELIQKYLEGLISPEELAELEHLLVADPVVADAFAEAARLHATLQGYFLQQYKMDQIASLLNTPDVPSRSPGRIGERERPAGAASSAARPASTFVSTNGQSTTAHYDSPRRSGRFLIKRLKWLVALLLLVALGAAIWSTKKSETHLARLISGKVTVAGREVSRIPDNQIFEVMDGAPAVIEMAGGARIELLIASRAVIREEKNQSVVVLHSGGGDFHIEPDQAQRFRVESLLGTVTTSGGRFSLDFITELPVQFKFLPTAAMRLPQLVVSVSDGSVVIANAGVSTTLTAGDKQVFFNQT